MGGQVWRTLFGAAVLAGCVLALAPRARADEWVPAARTKTGDVYEVDLNSVAKTGAVTEAWVRETLLRPQQDTASGKSFVLEFDQRYEDCTAHRFKLGMVTRRDKKGGVVASGLVPAPWQEIVPESIAEGVDHVICRVANPPPTKPWLEDITDGKWVPIGISADKKYYFSVLFDRVVKIGDDGAMVVARSDYVDYEPIDGFPVKYLVTANLLDCKHQVTASLGVDSYMSKTVRAESVRVAEKAISFQPINSGSFLASSVSQICASAVAPPDSGEKGQSGDVASGTAWGVTKGYLVTASHVIKDARKIAVYADGQPVGTARVVVDDPANDVAILKLAAAPAAPLNVLPLAEHGAALGKSVFTLGYPEPDTLGEHVKMTSGEVSATTGAEDDTRLLQISVPIQPGNSGGPIIGWDGEVVGVADASIQKFDDAPSQNVNYAVKVSYVRAMLEDLPDLGGYVVVKAAATHDAMITAARKAVFMLKVTQ